jgi:hypothetical protein
LIVLASIGSLKTTVILTPGATPAAPDAGVTETTVGASVSATVVNDQTLGALIAFPAVSEAVTVAV